MVERGGPHAYVAWMSAAEAQSWLIIGDWRECEARLRVALGSDPGPLGDVVARLVAARLAALQGRQAEAESHLLRVEELMVDGSAFLGLEFDAVHAEVRFAARDLDGAYPGGAAWRGRSGAPPTMCEWLMPLAARALADRVQSAHDDGRTDEDALATAGRAGRAIPARDPRTSARRRGCGEAPRRARRAVRGGAARARAHADAGGPRGRSPWMPAPTRRCRGRRRTRPGARRRRCSAAATIGARVRRCSAADSRSPGASSARPVEDELLDLGAGAHGSRSRSRQPRHPSAPAALHGLTDREREVLDLIAVGRTYAEIARALMISEKTVSTHVSHLLAKTATGKPRRARRASSIAWRPITTSPTD